MIDKEVRVCQSKCDKIFMSSVRNSGDEVIQTKINQFK